MRGLDLYGLLGASRSASLEDLRACYLKLIEEPRTVAGRDLIRDAYAVLGDPRLSLDPPFRLR